MTNAITYFILGFIVLLIAAVKIGSELLAVGSSVSLTIAFLCWGVKRDRKRAERAERDELLNHFEKWKKYY